MASTPLEGIKVVDFSRVLAGPAMTGVADFPQEFTIQSATTLIHTGEI